MSTISQIDRQINAVRMELRSREGIKRDDAASWQAAWDRHPDLHAREIDLFRQRGEAQRVRDEKAYAVAARATRAKRAKRCPTCHAQTLYAA